MSHASLHDLAEEQEIDLTPLIDCFLMLIIFFSCLEFRSLEAKLAIALPKQVGASAVAAPPEEVLQLTIECDAVGTVHPRHPGARILRDGTDAHGYRLQGHRVHYRLQGTLCATLPALREALLSVARKASPTGAPGVPVVLEPAAGTTYGDVAEVVDEVLATGFHELRFGGGRGRRR